MELPLGTSELYKLLGAHDNEHVSHGREHQAEQQAPENAAAHQEVSAAFPGSALEVPKPPGAAIFHDKFSNTVVIKKTLVFKWLKHVWPYALIFVAAFSLFLILFTNFSIKSIFTSSTKIASTGQVRINYSNLNAYNAWINSYFYEVTDSKILDPSYDISGNGLTNYQKFILGLNPKRTDSMGLGITDAQALIEGLNPLTGTPLTDAQKKIVADNIDLEALSNSVTLAAAGRSSQVAGVSTEQNNLGGNLVNISTNTPATLDIPSLNIKAPVIWTQDPKSFDADLQNGVVHYPGTALPGSMGTAYISGHSSNYAWAKGSYNKIFSTLGNLKAYDIFSITAKDTAGKEVILHYVVMGSQVYKADDQAQFANQGRSVVALSTCWPVGTSSNRLVVFAQISQVDRQ